MTQSVLLTGPITGMSYQEAIEWRENARNYFYLQSINVIDPLRGAQYLSEEKYIALSYENQPLHSGKCLNARSRFDVERCTIVLANFLGAKEKSVIKLP